jgi:hypothetical protein
VRSRPPKPCPEEPVAQMVEHLTFNQGVDGSIPSGLTKQKQALSRKFIC